MPSQKFNSAKPIVDGLGPGHQRLDSPARSPSPRADWATPLLQSATISCIVALLTLSSVLIGGGRFSSALQAAGLFFLICLLVTFFLFVNRAHRSMFHHVDHRPPKEPEPEIRPIISSNKGRYVNPQTVRETVEPAKEEKCPYKPKTLRWFVWHAELAGTQYSVWEKELGRDKYTAWRDALIKAGHAEWISYSADGKPNVTQGWYFVMPATEICKHIRES